MKKVIQFGLLLIVLFTVIFYHSTIVNYIVDYFFFSEGVTIDSGNEYTLNYDYVYVQQTDNFYAKSKQHLYNIIYTGLNNGNDSFYFFCDYDECINDVNKLNIDNLFLYINSFVHPFNGYHKLYLNITDYKKITITIEKTYSEESIKKINKKIDEITAQIITNNMTLTEKIKTFHDYIINNTKYDSDYILNNLNDPESTSHNALGPLFYSKSLCGGYTDVMAIFLNRLNIPNYRITSELHTWNLVYIDNNWLHLDLTWDDPVTYNKQDMLLDKFFLINTSTLKSYNTDYHDFNPNIYVEANYN